MNKDSYCILGVEIKEQELSFSLVNLKGQLLEARYQRCSIEEHPLLAVDIILDTLSRKSLSQGEYSLIGVGVCLHESSEAVASSMKILQNRLSELCGDRFKIPVLFDRPANLGALAEHYWGNGAKDLAFVHDAESLSLGLMIDGKIHRGVRGRAGDLGKITGDYSDNPELLYQDIGTKLSHILLAIDVNTLIIDTHFQRFGEGFKEGLGRFFRQGSQQDIEILWSSFPERSIGAAAKVLEMALTDLSYFPSQRRAAEQLPKVARGEELVSLLF